MGRRARLRGIKRTSKRLESDILDRAKSLSEDPEILRPKCAGNCRRCHFDKTFKNMAKLSKFRDSAPVLEKYAAKGSDGIFKAYAGTISLYAAGSVPYTATAKVAGEDILYVPRGAVGNDKIIGCQHYNDPKLRLFLYNEFAKKNRLNLYSFGDDLVCSNEYNMPEDYLYDAFWETPYEFPDDEIQCGHDKEPALVIRVRSLNKSVRICRRCAKDVSTLQYLVSRMVSLAPLEDFEVSVEHNYHVGGSPGVEPVPADMVKEYSLGKITDVNLIKRILKEKLGDLKACGASAYIVGSENYGGDLDRFIGSLTGDKVEIKALTNYLKDNCESIVIQNPKASEAIAAIWESSYRGLIVSISSEETADILGDVSRKNPLEILRDAERTEISKDISKSLPVFRNMGPVTKMADIYAKASMAGGFDLLKDEFVKLPPRDYKERSLARAFAAAVGNSPETIKCSAEEDDLAQFLVPFVKQLVESNGENYRDRMGTLLTATGCGETLN